MGLIILVTSRIYCLMNRFLKKLKGTSMCELLTKLNGLKAETEKENYVIKNKVKETRTLFEKLEIKLPDKGTEIAPLPSSPVDPT